MGRKGKWFGAVKKVFSPDSKDKSHKSKDKSEANPYADPPFEASPAAPVPPPPPPPPPPQTPAQVAEFNEEGLEQGSPDYSVAVATAAAAEAAITAAQAAAEVVRLTAGRFHGKSREEIAATKIQTAFRGYLARRALRALKGLVRLKSLMHGNSVKRQSATTLRCMQTLSRVQCQIRSRRIRMTEENQALQRQLQLKREQELEALKAAMGDDWDDSLQSKEQIQASIVNKHEAAIKRERAMAYAYAHQWKSSSRSVNPMFTDLNNPNWGWSWLERWMASRPWESRSLTEKEGNNDHGSVKSLSCTNEGEVMKSYSRRDSQGGKPPSRQFASTPLKTSSVTRKMRPPSPREDCGPDDDARSTFSVQSEKPRRHSLPSSFVRDDESLASSFAVPSYMTPTESARAKSRSQSQSGDKIETPEKGGSMGLAKKRLSFPATEKSAASTPISARRLSGPKVAAIPIAAGNGSS